MNLKPFVNNKDLYDDFLEELDQRIVQEQRGLEHAVDEKMIYRHQGAIHMLRRLKQLKDKVNG